MSDSMLSQEEVDALFKQATGKSIVHMPSSAPSEKPLARPSAPTPQPRPPVPAAAVPVTAAMPEQAPSATTPPVPAPAAAPAVTPPLSVPQEPRPRPVVSTPAVTIVPAAQPCNDALVKHLEELVAELTIRLAKAENRLSQLEQNKLSQQASQNKAYSKELARLDARLENLKSRAEATPGYNARHLFTCSSCGTTGRLSIPVKCTQCGEEGWWGWWPRKKLEE